MYNLYKKIIDESINDIFLFGDFTSEYIKSIEKYLTFKNHKNIKLKPNKIKFITYLFEGFRGDNSSILIDYNTKYPPKKLNDDEKEALNDLLKNINRYIKL